MPGMFGAIGCPVVCSDRLQQGFAEVWQSAETLSAGDGIIGGHTYQPGRSVFRSSGGVCFAVDGDVDIYEFSAAHADAPSPQLWRHGPSGLTLEIPSAGNAAIADEESGAWTLLMDGSGAFPLYYSTAAGGLMFCTLLRPLVAAIRTAVPVELDLASFIQYMQRGYTYAERSHYRQVRRLLPGQVLEYQSRDGLFQIRETSELWTTQGNDWPKSTDEAADLFWHELGSAAKRTAHVGKCALMLSGGWDSRTLLASHRADECREPLVCYSHGDLDSREMTIARRLCVASGLPGWEEPLTSAAYNQALIDALFSRVESGQHPHWLHAGRLLAEEGTKTVIAGSYGEVMGGHLGRAVMNRGARKILAVAGDMTGMAAKRDEKRGIDLTAMRQMLFPLGQEKPWYLAEEVWNQVPKLREELREDVDWELRRLMNRGVSTDGQVLDAFMTEHYISQCCNEQSLSTRASTGVSLPFAAKEILSLATRIPMNMRIQNTLNRLIVKKNAPDLATIPTAATLVRADAPIVLQEASRLVRRHVDNARWRMHSVSKGLLPYPRTSWWQLEFLRDGVLFNRLLDDLAVDIWDLKEIRGRVERNAQTQVRFHWRSSTALLSQHILRISSVDRLLR